MLRCAWDLSRRRSRSPGTTPIVDIQSVTQQRVLDKEVLDAIPAGRNHANFAMLIPGMSGALDYGGTNNLNLSTLSVHGSRTGDQRVMVDGMSISATSGNGELSNFIPDMTATQEVAVSYSAGAADQAFGGVQMNLIPREGGNSFKGSFFATGVNSKFQGSNYTQELKDAGLRTPNSIKLVYDVNPGVGGPIVRDKLWFYSAARWQSTQTYVAGLWENKNAGDPTKWTYDPDLDRPAVLPLIQKSANTRVTWQITPRNKVAGFYEHQYRVVGAAHAHHRLRIGHEVRLPTERIPHRHLHDADHQQAVVRCACLGHHPGLERPVPRGRRQPGVHQAAP